MLSEQIVEDALEAWSNWEEARRQGWHEGDSIPVHGIYRAGMCLLEMLLEHRPVDIIRYCRHHRRLYLTKHETIHGCGKCHKPEQE